jgi:hypothetical protein
MKSAAVLLLLLAACATASPAGQRGPSAIIVPRCPLADASLWIDGRFVGEVDDAQGGVRLTAGRHRIEFRRDGYLTRYLEPELAAGSKTQLACDLREDLR